ncbi:hypothetical protein EJB05_37421, partial [Eragrostis curvula]
MASMPSSSSFNNSWRHTASPALRCAACGCTGKEECRLCARWSDGDCRTCALLPREARGWRCVAQTR